MFRHVSRTDDVVCVASHGKTCAPEREFLDPPLLRSWIRQFSSTLIIKLELTSLVRFIGEPWPPFSRPVMQHLANSGDSGETNDLSLVL
jgi:hypothetical protein